MVMMVVMMMMVIVVVIVIVLFVRLIVLEQNSLAVLITQANPFSGLFGSGDDYRRRGRSGRTKLTARQFVLSRACSRLI